MNKQSFWIDNKGAFVSLNSVVFNDDYLPPSIKQFVLERSALYIGHLRFDLSIVDTSIVASCIIHEIDEESFHEMLEIFSEEVQGVKEFLHEKGEGDYVYVRI